MQRTPSQSAAGLPAYVGRTGAIRILFVEDDEYYRENLVAKRSERGFVVHSFTDATWLLHKDHKQRRRSGNQPFPRMIWWATLPGAFAFATR